MVMKQKFATLIQVYMSAGQTRRSEGITRAVYQSDDGAEDRDEDNYSSGLRPHVRLKNCPRSRIHLLLTVDENGITLA